MLRWRAEISRSAPNLAFWRVNVARAPATEVRLSRRLHRHLSRGADQPGKGRLLCGARLPLNLLGDAGGLSGGLLRTCVLVLAGANARRQAAGTLPEDEEALRQGHPDVRALRRAGDLHHAVAVRTARHVRGDHRNLSNLAAEIPAVRGADVHDLGDRHRLPRLL